MKHILAIKHRNRLGMIVIEHHSGFKNELTSTGNILEAAKQEAIHICSRGGK